MKNLYWYKKGCELLKEISSTHLSENMIALWFFGQESIAVKSGETIIYIDPYFSDSKDKNGVSRRKFAPPFEPSEISNASWVMCTHNHSDHLNMGTLAPLSVSSPEANFIVPAPHVSILEESGIDDIRIVPAKAGMCMKINENISVLPIAAAHEEYQTDENGNQLCLGYIIDLNGITLYHAGDTVETEDMVNQLGKHHIDIACLPINGADWKRRKRGIVGNMNAREAADVAAECRADLVIPLHYDMFEGNGENPANFTDYIYKFYPALKHHIMVPGERFIYMRNV